jgi:hypothetical protein
VNGADVVIFTEHGQPRMVEFQNGGVATGTINGLTNATVYASPGRTPELTLTVPLAQFHILPMVGAEAQEPEPEPKGNDNPTLQLPVDQGASTSEPRGREKGRR